MRGHFAAISGIGLVSSAAAVLGLSMEMFGPWPAVGLVVLGWMATAFLLTKVQPIGQSAPINMPAGLRLDERNFTTGDTIIQEGDPASSLYVIIAGKVQVWRNDDYGSRIDIAELVPGQIFGEMGLLNGGTRTASVEAVGPVRLFEVPREMFETLIAESGSIATMIREIADRRQSAQ